MFNKSKLPFHTLTASCSAVLAAFVAHYLFTESIIEDGIIAICAIVISLAAYRSSKAARENTIHQNDLNVNTAICSQRLFDDLVQYSNHLTILLLNESQKNKDKARIELLENALRDADKMIQQTGKVSAFTESQMSTLNNFSHTQIRDAESNTQ